MINLTRKKYDIGYVYLEDILTESRDWWLKVYIDTCCLGNIIFLVI